MNANLISTFSDVLALVYHEGRNVRHLARANQVSRDRYAALINLPTNRYEAWGKMQSFRAAASSCKTAGQAEEIFARQFGITLEGMAELYSHPGWRNSAVGGNQWAQITREVVRFRDLVDGGSLEEAVLMAEMILDLHHNTGAVASKLAGLEQWRSGASQ